MAVDFIRKTVCGQWKFVVWANLRIVRIPSGNRVSVSFRCPKGKCYVPSHGRPQENAFSVRQFQETDPPGLVSFLSLPLSLSHTLLPLCYSTSFPFQDSTLNRLCCSISTQQTRWIQVSCCIDTVIWAGASQDRRRSRNIAEQSRRGAKRKKSRVLMDFIDFFRKSLCNWSIYVIIIILLLFSCNVIRSGALCNWGRMDPIYIVILIKDSFALWMCTRMMKNNVWYLATKRRTADYGHWPHTTWFLPYKLLRVKCTRTTDGSSVSFECVWLTPQQQQQPLIVVYYLLLKFLLSYSILYCVLHLKYQWRRSDYSDGKENNFHFLFHFQLIGFLKSILWIFQVRTVTASSVVGTVRKGPSGESAHAERERVALLDTLQAKQNREQKWKCHRFSVRAGGGGGWKWEDVCQSSSWRAKSDYDDDEGVNKW